ncbi:hypothetical protein [Bilifractor sp. HCP3S3_D3]|uniref:hypothetical protein n=1 Tax=Bilifractor sp. HCP3S3_D3 TaxID=3438907 RepID=UPI003F8C985D
MILNFWAHDNIEFYCINKHKKPVKMTIMNGQTGQFYACPKYMLRDEAHPEGHDADERACSNRLSVIDAEQIVLTLSKEVEDDLVNGIMGDYTGTIIHVKQIDAKVLDYSDSKIKIGIVNRRAIKD